VVHIYISSTWEAVAERSQVQSQLGWSSKTLFQKPQINKWINKHKQIINLTGPTKNPISLLKLSNLQVIWINISILWDTYNLHCSFNLFTMLSW
jgi:hypothetical protein